MDGFFVAKFKKFANGERKLAEEGAEGTSAKQLNPETNEKEVKEKLAERKKKENKKKKLQKKQKKAAKQQEGGEKTVSEKKKEGGEKKKRQPEEKVEKVE